jgi:hypothetical protein
MAGKKKNLTEDQRKAIGERLAKARAKSNPPTYDHIHEDVRNLPDDAPLSRKNVMEWIKTNKEILSGIRRDVRKKVKGAIAREARVGGYVKSMEYYLTTGTWVDMFYGVNQDNKIRRICYRVSFDKNGDPHRENGVFYTDLGYTWSDEDVPETKDVQPKEQVNEDAEQIVLSDDAPPVKKKRGRPKKKPETSTEPNLFDTK